MPDNLASNTAGVDSDTDHRLDELADAAQREGRRLVVGAVVINASGEAFLQRRAPHARLFPGAWDIVGGHAEPGETPVAALGREIQEETGWRLLAVERVLAVFDWTGNDGEDKREVDVCARVEGDLTRPRIEWDRFTEFGWFDRPALQSLTARQPGDGRMIEVALAALA